ncbi:hypothetical protein DEO72_LG3g2551 [Vigna unguiculata]|uniref:Uncharacterized protein n=1 Tax=Vigna unguiculata TaxID=3917 RepID=A0A4D6LHG9_VIGUN|nr:hypothetical protein DEO72_LG3g2551 [Vigna unguiculata]
MTDQSCSIGVVKQKDGSPSELHGWERGFYASLGEYEAARREYRPPIHEYGY